MRKRIVYLMSHAAHMPYLVASLHTLRRWWTGEVAVYAWPESFEFVNRMAKDDRLAVTETRKRMPEYKGRNAQFLDKIRLMQSFNVGPGLNLYLDADTTIHGYLGPLFKLAGDHGFVTTQFNDWMSTGGIPRNRIKRLRQFPEIDQALVERVLAEPWPSVNGGVFCCRPDSPVLPLWERWTVAALKVFIADEAVLHLMQPLFYPSGELVTMTGGRFNCSPMRFQPKGLPDGDVVIRHYHGDSNVRPDNKSKKGFDLWWPIYQHCLKENVGGMADWRSEIKNKYLDRVERGLR